MTLPTRSNPPIAHTVGLNYPTGKKKRKERKKEKRKEKKRKEKKKEKKSKQIKKKKTLKHYRSQFYFCQKSLFDQNFQNKGPNKKKSKK